MSNYKINIFDGSSWDNLLTHENIDDLNGSSEGYHISQNQYNWLNQDISSNSSPSFYNTNMSGDISVWNNDSNFITAADASINVFTQSTASNTWTITHNFGTKYVMVQVYNDNDTIIYPQSIELTDNNSLTISFDENLTGYVLYSKLTSTSPISNPAADHGSLTGLLSDDHTQYILVDGTRGFSNTISGIDPTLSNHLATKHYIDNKTWLSNDIIDIQTTISNNSDVASNTTHKNSTGEDHSWINQDVTISSAPQFYLINCYGPNSILTNDSNYITSSSVTFENLNINGDVGTGSNQVAQGNHNHANIFFTDSPSGNINISNGWTDLTFENEVINDSYYTFTNDFEVQVSQTGLYKISYGVTTYVTTYSNDSDSEVKIQKDSGSGYSDIQGSISGQYNGSSTDGLNNSSKEIMVSLINNDKVKIQARRKNGSSTIQTYPNSCTFLIEFIR